MGQGSAGVARQPPASSAACLNGTLLPPTPPLPAGSLLLGYWLSRALGMPEPTARSHCIAAGMRNSALAGQLAATYFPAHPLAALPCIVSACTHTLLGTVAALYFREQQLDAPALAVAFPTGERNSSDNGSGSSGGSGGGGPAPPGPDLSALLAAAAAQLQPLAAAASARWEAAGAQLEAVATATRTGVRSVLVEAAGQLVPELSAEVEGQMAVLQERALELAPSTHPTQPSANPLAMNVVMVGAECAPWSKTGKNGLLRRHGAAVAAQQLKPESLLK